MKRSGARDVVFWKIVDAGLEREKDQSSDLTLSCYTSRTTVISVGSCLNNILFNAPTLSLQHEWIGKQRPTITAHGKPSL